MPQYAASDLRATKCLGIAIDHRIRHLFQQVPPVNSGNLGDHISIIKQNGKALRCPTDEVEVTGDFAGPRTIGGIAVVLKQPRNKHAFEDGPVAVIEDCEALRGLSETFTAVSCGTVNMLEDVTVIDLLPYLTPQDIERIVEEDDYQLLRQQFQVSVDAVCCKRPDVLLCAGRAGAPQKRSYFQWNRCKGEAAKLEAIGVGRTFNGPTTQLRNAAGSSVDIERVNGLHPSFVLNHCPYYSSFRQLLILAVCQACRVYSDDWTEFPWMDDLRRHCFDLVHKLREEADDGPWNYPPDLIYFDIIKEVARTIVDIALTDDDPYNGLLRSSLSTLLNDASLALQGVRRETDDMDALVRVAQATYSLVTMESQPDGWFGNKRIKSAILNGLEEIGHCVSISVKWGCNIDLARAAAIFLSMAQTLELVLFELMPDNPPPLHKDSSIDKLQNAIQKLGL
ncbi:hypothetical protein NQ176_g653 [Zarea fungicola]|uniref:Uncharacterized protein n=1 Tax=Zarea fungicola TaxID=93591 RepID=A0ACC1NX89_9HYPO|nr:hypothetical protein NQ176_g653 [Lecanicillium fungicola]